MKKSLNLVLSVFLLLSFIFSSSVVSAADLTNSIIKDIKVEKTDGSNQNFTYRERAKVSVLFDATGQSVKSGDTVSVKLPEQLRGYSTTISLTNSEGIVMGNCTISPNDITCIFNENVDNLNNIKGSFYFSAEVNVSTEGTNNIALDFGNTNISKNIVVENASAGPDIGSDELFFKSGSIQPDSPGVVNWGIRFNNKQDYFGPGSPAVITDSLGVGQEYDLSSFQFSVKTINQNPVYVNVDDFKQQYGGIEFSDNGFTITLNNPTYTELMIYYDTTIKDKSLANFTNNADAQFTDKNGVPQKETYSASVANIEAGGNIEGELAKYSGNLVINKVGKDSDGNKVALKGAKFSLINNTGEVVDTQITNEQGQLTFQNVQGGTHKLKEIEVPPGYQIDQSNFPSSIVLDFRNTKMITQEIVNIKVEEPTTEEPTTEAPTTEEPTTEEPTTEEPTTEEPTTEEPTTEEPTTEEPTTEAPTTEEPTTEAPTTEEPTTEAPTTEEPTTEEPTTEEPTTEEPTTEEPTTEEPTTEEPTTEEPTTEAPTTEEPTTEAPTTEAPTTEEPTTEAPTTEAPTTEAPTTEAPTTEAPTTEEPTTEAPTTEEPTTEAPTTEAPTTEAPTTEEPTTEAPTTEAPTTEEPTTEAPTTEEPTTEAPTTEEPTTEAPTTEEPTTEAPTTEEPTTEAPTTEEPTTEAPTTEEPTTEAPTTEEPTTEAPTTEEPTTEAPTTEEPTTEAPTTEEPTTEAPIIKNKEEIKSSDDNKRLTSNKSSETMLPLTGEPRNILFIILASIFSILGIVFITRKVK